MQETNDCLQNREQRHSLFKGFAELFLKAVVLITALLFLPALVRAQELSLPRSLEATPALSLTTEFQAEWENVISILKDHGLSELGNSKGYGPKGAVNLDFLLREIKTIKVLAVDQIDKPEGASRYSGFYDDHSRTIYLDKNLTKSRRIPLYFHEGLGALKMGDGRYELSLPLSLIVDHSISSFPQILKVLKDHLKSDELAERLRFGDVFNWDQGPNSQMILAGGGSLVGGGGDATSLLIRRDYILTRIVMAEIRIKELSFSDFGAGALKKSLLNDMVEPLTCPAGTKFNKVIFHIVPGYLDSESRVIAYFPTQMSIEKVVEQMLWFRNIEGKTSFHPQIRESAEDFSYDQDSWVRRITREECKP